MSTPGVQRGPARRARWGGVLLAGGLSLGAHAAVGVWAWVALGVPTGPGERDPALREARISLVMPPRSLPTTNAGPSVPPSAPPSDAAAPAMTGTTGVSGRATAASDAPPASERGSVALPGAAPSGWSSSLTAGTTEVTFAGLSARGARARSVVYVVDASGSMVTTLPAVLAEVRRSVEGLAPTQRFGVVLFGGGLPGGVTAFDTGLVDANPRQRGRLASWLAGASPAGGSSPLDGLRAGLAMRPQVIFLLSRSIERSGGGQWGEGLEATLAELDRLNPIDPASGLRPAIIKTVQFLEPDPTGTMQAIARVHGGAAGERSAIVMTGVGVKERNEP